MTTAMKADIESMKGHCGSSSKLYKQCRVLDDGAWYSALGEVDLELISSDLCLCNYEKLESASFTSQKYSYWQNGVEEHVGEPKRSLTPIFSVYNAIIDDQSTWPIWCWKALVSISEKNCYETGWQTSFWKECFEICWHDPYSSHHAWSSYVSPPEVLYYLP